MNRTLKPWIQTTLEIITAVLTVSLISINDFSISALPFILLVFGLVILNTWILEVFGKC